MYRILKNQKNEYKIQQRIFFLWFDCTESYLDGWYTLIFESKEKAQEYIDQIKGDEKDVWEVV